MAHCYAHLVPASAFSAADRIGIRRTQYASNLTRGGQIGPAGYPGSGQANRPCRVKFRVWSDWRTIHAPRPKRTKGSWVGALCHGRLRERLCYVTEAAQPRLTLAR